MGVTSSCMNSRAKGNQGGQSQISDAGHPGSSNVEEIVPTLEAIVKAIKTAGGPYFMQPPNSSSPQTRGGEADCDRLGDTALINCYPLTKGRPVVARVDHPNLTHVDVVIAYELQGGANSSGKKPVFLAFSVGSDLANNLLNALRVNSNELISVLTSFGISFEGKGSLPIESVPDIDFYRGEYKVRIVPTGEFDLRKLEQMVKKANGEKLPSDPFSEQRWECQPLTRD